MIYFMGLSHLTSPGYDYTFLVLRLFDRGIKFTINWDRLHIFAPHKSSGLITVGTGALNTLTL